MRTRHRLGAVVASGLLVAAAGCGSDDGAGPALTPSTGSTTTITASAPEGALPPAAALDLEPYYGADLAAIGMRLTDRGGLIDRSGGGYLPSAEGTHLALYVEPIGDRTLTEYLDGIRSVTAIFAGDIFDRWPGLVSFDVCQEPTTADDARPEPLPVTQIEMTRDEAAAFDFTSATVLDLMRASRADPPGLALRVSSEVARDPGYTTLVAEAG